MTNHIIHPLITCYGKKQSYVRRILVRRFFKKSDISLYDHKFDLIYYQWNSREPGAFPNVSVSMCYHDNSISHYF